MRQAATVEIDMLLTLAPILSRMPRQASSALLSQFMERFGAERRGTRYDLGNVITATARTLRAPQARWDAEELGGAVFAGRILTTQPGLAARRGAVRRELMTA